MAKNNQKEFMKASIEYFDKNKGCVIIENYYSPIEVIISALNIVQDNENYEIRSVSINWERLSTKSNFRAELLGSLEDSL